MIGTLGTLCEANGPFGDALRFFMSRAGRLRAMSDAEPERNFRRFRGINIGHSRITILRRPAVF